MTFLYPNSTAGSAPCGPDPELLPAALPQPPAPTAAAAADEQRDG